MWNSISGRYEPMASLGDGLDGVTALAKQVRVIWAQQDPARSSLREPPYPAEGDETEWAEYRVSFQAIRVYETHDFDRPGRKKAMNRTAAIETTCNDVGFVLP